MTPKIPVGVAKPSSTSPPAPWPAGLSVRLPSNGGKGRQAASFGKSPLLEFSKTT